MTPERLEEIKKNVDLWLDDDGSVLELITALEDAWAEQAAAVCAWEELAHVPGIAPIVIGKILQEDGLIKDWAIEPGQITGLLEAVEKQVRSCLPFGVESVKARHRVVALIAEIEKQRRKRKWALGHAKGWMNLERWWRNHAEQVKAERDKWMGQFDKAEHRGLAYMEERDRYDRALQSLTPGGSEFVHDPERCVAFVQQARRGEMETMRRLAAKLKEYEAFNEPLKRVYNENTAEEATP